MGIGAWVHPALRSHMASLDKVPMGLHMTLPTWDGRAETLAEYRGEVALLVLGTPVEQRPLLGARLVAALSRNAMARRLAMRLPRTLVKEQGDRQVIRQTSSAKAETKTETRALPKPEPQLHGAEVEVLNSLARESPLLEDLL